MGYESGTLPSYPELRNCSYSVKLFTPRPCLFLRFVYHVLIPPLHQPAHTRHPLHLCSQCISGEAGHPLCYGHLPPLDIHPYGVEPRGFHYLISCYLWCNAIRSLSISPVTNQISLPYNSTNCATAMYIAPWSRTVAPVLSSTIAIMPHHRRRRFHTWGG